MRVLHGAQASAEEELERRRVEGTLQPADLDDLVSRLTRNDEFARYGGGPIATTGGWNDQCMGR